MGAWGIGTFENDSALDWLFDYEAGGATAVLSAFSDFHQSVIAGYADVDLGSAVMAAGEVVATAFGAPLKGLQPELLEDLAAHSADVKKLPEIRPKAAKAVSDAVGLTDKSELAGLWDDAGQSNALQDVADELIRRLEGKQ